MISCQKIGKWVHNRSETGADMPNNQIYHVWSLLNTSCFLFLPKKWISWGPRWACSTPSCWRGFWTPWQVEWKWEPSNLLCMITVEHILFHNFSYKVNFMESQMGLTYSFMLEGLLDTLASGDGNWIHQIYHSSSPLNTFFS